jgi:hypothetical protein
VRVSSGEEGMPWIRKCNVKIPKLSVSTPTARSLRCRAEDANIADVLSDLCLSVAPRHCSDSWSEFHDFVLRLPLPSVRDAPTAGSRKTTRRPQKRKRTECKETNKKPLSGDPLPSTLVSSLLTHLRDKPVHTAGEGSQADSWSSIDRLLDRLPPPPAPAAQEMREQRETESQRAACSENKGPHQRGHQLENSVPHQRGNELENSVPHQRGNENSVPHQRGNELENSVPHRVPHQRGNELENSVPHQRGREEMNWRTVSPTREEMKTVSPTRTQRTVLLPATLIVIYSLARVLKDPVIVFVKQNVQCTSRRSSTVSGFVTP